MLLLQGGFFDAYLGGKRSSAPLGFTWDFYIGYLCGACGLDGRSESGDVPERPLCGHVIDLNMWGFTSN